MSILCNSHHSGMTYDHGLAESLPLDGGGGF
jgi:hypothetical protein